LVDRSSRPLSCPHQMDPRVEARIVEMRREHPGWGSRTILFWLEREGVVPVPGRSSVDGCLVRHGLITSQPRRRKRSDYKRWERSRVMELWQMQNTGPGGLDLLAEPAGVGADDVIETHDRSADLRCG
jgi:hypothetical protein